MKGMTFASSQMVTEAARGSSASLGPSASSATAGLSASVSPVTVTTLPSVAQTDALTIPPVCSRDRRVRRLILASSSCTRDSAVSDDRCSHLPPTLLRPMPTGGHGGGRYRVNLAVIVSG